MYIFVTSNPSDTNAHKHLTTPQLDSDDEPVLVGLSIVLVAAQLRSILVSVSSDVQSLSPTVDKLLAVKLPLV